MRLTPSDPDVQTVVGRIADGSLDLQPNFQRGEVWSISKRQRLIDSILRDWHVPPIHVVVDVDNRQLVLDGQQRLASIRDFFANRFSIDGKIPPSEAAIRDLDGLFFKDLSPDWQRRFTQFTLRIYRITNYEPSEPGELFFRLNQPASLTAAEQRNAFFGKTREQVKRLVKTMEKSGLDGAFWGFGNSRMAYDDVLSRACLFLENGTLKKKITSTTLADRYRTGIPFPPEVEQQLADTFDLLARSRNYATGHITFNKATAQTWLLFVATLASGELRPEADDLANFMVGFEKQRSLYAVGVGPTKEFTSVIDDFGQRSSDALLQAYEDRSTSRVADTTSVIIRDFVLWCFFWAYESRSGAVPINEKQFVDLHNLSEDGIEIANPNDVEALVLTRGWGDLRRNA